MIKFSIILSVFIFILGGCMTAKDHREAVQDDSGDRVSVGTVQKEIKIGMSGAEVISVLGSPNIVSMDSDRHEAWVYDKFSSDVTASQSSGGVGFYIFSGGGSGAVSRNQKTLTVIIKFDGQKLVKDFSYHTSRF